MISVSELDRAWDGDRTTVKTFWGPGRGERLCESGTDPEGIGDSGQGKCEKKKHRFIGTILVGQGYFKHSQISEVLKAME